MNNLNNSNLKDLVISTFQEILAEDPNFFLTDRLSVLTWKSKKIEGALITKIGNVRYLGYLRKDIKGQEYWKYKPLTANPETSGESPAIPDNLVKLQARQEQTKNYEQSSNSNEQSTNNS